MTPQAIVDALEANLAAERVAVIALDGTRVSELGEEKDQLVSALASTRMPMELLPRLHELVAVARHNCLLLAHARESLRGAAAAVAGQMHKGTTSSEDAPRRGVRVSVTG